MIDFEPTEEQRLVRAERGPVRQEHARAAGARVRDGARRSPRTCASSRTRWGSGSSRCPRASGGQGLGLLTARAARGGARRRRRGARRSGSPGPGAFGAAVAELGTAEQARGSARGLRRRRTGTSASAPSRGASRRPNKERAGFATIANAGRRRATHHRARRRSSCNAHLADRFVVFAQVDDGQAAGAASARSSSPKDDPGLDGRRAPRHARPRRRRLRRDRARGRDGRRVRAPRRRRGRRRLHPRHAPLLRQARARGRRARRRPRALRLRHRARVLRARARPSASPSATSRPSPSRSPTGTWTSRPRAGSSGSAARARGTTGVPEQRRAPRHRAGRRLRARGRDAHRRRLRAASTAAPASSATSSPRSSCATRSSSPLCCPTAEQLDQLAAALALGAPARSRPRAPDARHPGHLHLTDGGHAMNRLHALEEAAASSRKASTASASTSSGR